MSNRTWFRPVDIAYPTVWSKFSRNGLDFQIQDITPNLYSTSIKFMSKYFLPDEPLYTAINFLSDAASVEEQQDWWVKILPEKLSLVCLVTERNDPSKAPEIAGINFLYYHHKSDDEGNAECKGEKFKTVCDIVKYVESKIERYNLLKIEEYIDEFGLCVHPKFRGMGIATELLKARSSLGKAVGLKATLTIFSAIASQKAAEKAEYAQVVEISYAELARIVSVHELNVKDTPTMKYMYKLFCN